MKTHIALLFIIFSLFINSCTPDLKVPKPDPGSADFSKTIAIGGNYMAGYQDGALYQKAQIHSIPALLAQQFKLVGGNAFNQALMPDNNGLGLNPKPWESPFLSPFHLGYKTDCQHITSLTPFNDSIPVSAASPYLKGIAGNSIQNLSVPFANTAAYFSPLLGNSFPSGNPYYNRIASNPGTSTLFEDAKAQDGTFITAWLGMEDIYNYAATGGTRGTIPSGATFGATLDALLGSLTANGAKGVIATIPDLRVYPYYTLVPWDNAVVTKVQADSLNYIYSLSGLSHIHFNEGRNGFVIDDTASTGSVRQLHEGEFITLSVPLDSMKCHKYGLLAGTINKRYILDDAEVAAIGQAIDDYNAVIVQKAAQYNLALADMNAFFNAVKSGIKFDGVDFNTEFITGGFFSLDGYHPNQKGYALIANKFIEAINNKYNAAIPLINCTECDGVLFP